MSTTTITFKRGPRATGLLSVSEPWPQVDIKINRKRVGWIQPPTHNAMRPSSHWRIWLHVADTKERRGWRNICLTVKFNDEQPAREWCIKHALAIAAKAIPIE